MADGVVLDFDANCDPVASQGIAGRDTALGSDTPNTEDRLALLRALRERKLPHRNAILGRSSTAEELVFLGEPGSSF